MKSKLMHIICITLALSVASVTLMPKQVQAKTIKNERQSQITKVKYKFVETPQETINKMKIHLNDKADITSNINDIQVKASPTLRAATNPVKSDISQLAGQLRLAGFEHSAQLLDYSIKDMKEDPLVFYNTSSFTNDIYNYFGSLHSVTLNLGIVREGLGWQFVGLIEDRYDFDTQQYKGLVSVVNNMAYNAQVQKVIVPYDIEIYLDRNNLRILPYGMPTW